MDTTKKMRAWRLSDEADLLLNLLAKKLTEESGGAVQYTKTDALELAIRALAKKKKVIPENV